MRKIAAGYWLLASGSVSDFVRRILALVVAHITVNPV